MKTFIEDVADGSCSMGSTSIRSDSQAITGIKGFRATTVSYKEHDKNGGDCHVRGVLFCR